MCSIMLLLRKEQSSSFQFLRCLSAVHGKEFAIDTLECLVNQWTDSDVGLSIPQFSDFLAGETETLGRHGYWSNGKSRVVHVSAGGRCKPTRWDRVVLRNLDSNRSVLCEKCGATMTQEVGPNNAMHADGNSAALHSRR